MFGFVRKNRNEEVLYSPVIGKRISLSEVKDAMFANKLLGDGVAFQLDNDVIKSPCNGEVVMIAPTKHALGLRSSIGTEIIIHVGLDTVNLEGKGFQVLIQTGQKIKTGTPILRVDTVFMREHNIDLTTPMVITNGDSHHMEAMNTNVDICYQDIVMKVSK